MTTTSHCLASLARLSLTAPLRPLLPTTIPRFLAPSIIAQQRGYAAGKSSSGRKKEKKRKQHKNFRVDRLDNMEQFSLCDVMRYARAFEVGQPPTSIKYELHLKLKTPKSGPVIKNRIRLPYPVRSDRRIGVICKENSAVAIQARAAGAVAVGEESLFQIIREGSIKFTSMICDKSSEEALKKANLGRILGPKQLMPSVRTKTITGNVLALLKEMAGADNYREKDGVVRIAIGQLGFSPEMLAANVRAFVKQVKEDCVALEDQSNKQLHEVVMSTTRGPGFSLNGGFNPTDKKLQPSMLTSPM